MLASMHPSPLSFRVSPWGGEKRRQDATQGLLGWDVGKQVLYADAEHPDEIQQFKITNP